MATKNPWKAFEGLLPKTSRVIGIVAHHNVSGTSTITLRDGSALTIRGHNIAIGKKVLVNNGEDIREVPDLLVSTVYV